MDWNKLLGPGLLTNTGLVVLAISLLMRFAMPTWMYYLAGGLVLVGTIWWFVNQVRR